MCSKHRQTLEKEKKIGVLVANYNKFLVKVKLIALYNRNM